MLVIPNRLLGLDNVHTLFQSSSVYILKKELKEATLNRYAYISMPVISIVTKGMQRIRTHDGKCLEVKAGNMIFLKQGLYTISDLLTEKEGFCTYLFFFNKRLLADFLKQELTLNLKPEKSPKEYYNYPTGTLVETYLQQLDHLAKAIKGNNNPSLLANIKLKELFTFLSQHHVDHKTLRTVLYNFQYQPSRDLRQFLENNFDKPLTIKDYAQLTGYSVSSFQRIFKEEFDLTPRRWLTRRRMKKALRLLKEKSHNVTQVAYEVGYENISHFIRAFKQEYKSTPKQLLLQESSSRLDILNEKA